MTKTDLPEPVQKWIAELRSGKYKQATGALHKIEPGQDSYCCLGIACKLAVEEDLPLTISTVDTVEAGGHVSIVRYGGSSGSLPPRVREWLGVRSPYGTIGEVADKDYESLANLNDRGATFKEIADTIEERWEDLKA